jgi:hypothetical protein
MVTIGLYIIRFNILPSECICLYHTILTINRINRLGCVVET